MTVRFHQISGILPVIIGLLCIGCPSDEPPANTAAFFDIGTTNNTSVLDVSTVDIWQDSGSTKDTGARDAISSAADLTTEDVSTGDSGVDQDTTTRPDDDPRMDCAADLDCIGMLTGLGPCDTAICEDGACTIDGKPIGTPCDDGDACTTDDGCVIAGCAGQPKSCPGDGLCNISSCEPTSGACTPVDTTGFPCDDGNPCTGEDVCEATQCIGIPGPCPTCQANADCEPFDDGDKCNGVPICAGGECVADASTISDCSVLSTTPCTEAICLPESGACTVVNLTDGVPCDQDSLCSSEGFCAQGTCIGTDTECDDGNICTNDICSDILGCVYQPVSDVICDDGEPCTSPDTCVGGDCVGIPALDCDDGDQCTIDSCNLEANTCIYTPAAGPCEDGNKCTVDDTCVNGACIGAALECTEATCAIVTCQPDEGCISTPLACDDGDECTTDACNSANGECEFSLTGTLCDNDVDCGNSDPCAVGICNDCGICEEVLVTCNDENPCTNDSCITDVGCEFIQISGPCDDGDNCTANDSCWEGKCEGTVNLCGPGTEANPAVNCEAIQSFDALSPSGVYWVILGTGPTEVFCEMNLAGGGWMRLGIASDSHPMCNLQDGFGSSSDVAAGGPNPAFLAAADVTNELWPKRQLLMRLPQGDYLFFSNLPGWNWPAIATGSVNASNMSDLQVAGGVLGTTLTSIESVPESSSFAGSPLIGGYANGLLTPFMGIGAMITGSFTQDANCEALTTFGGFYGGSILPPALWNTNGSVWIR